MPVVTTAGFELVRIRITGSKRKTLQIMAEREDKTMTAQDCADLSRALSATLEETDPIEGTYTLEVSSPGVDRPLTRLKDFHDWQGYDAKIELNRLVEGRKRFKGVLAGIDGDSVCIDCEGDEDTTLIPFEWVDNAKLEMTDDLFRDSLRAGKAAMKDLVQTMNDNEAAGKEPPEHEPKETPHGASGEPQ